MMKRRAKRPIFFVCSGLVNNDLISEIFEAQEKTLAEKFFEEKFGFFPKIVFGPFYKKRVFQPQTKTTDIVFSGDIRQAEFDGWVVSATILKKPENFAFVLFDHRIDQKKIPKPQGPKIIPINEIKFRTT